MTSRLFVQQKSSGAKTHHHPGPTHAAFSDPVGNFLISDVLSAGALQELVCFLLLQLNAAAALLVEFFVALPQLKQGFAALKTLCYLLQ